MAKEPIGMTRRIAKFIVETKKSDIPAPVYEHAKIAFMDWLGVTLAGKDELLVKMLIRYTDVMGGNPQATVIGHNVKKSLAQAALINGSASHALDYDDTILAFLGHPSVTLFPGLLALGEWEGKTGEDFLTSYIIGLKAGVTIASCAGGEHYIAGWHGTSTMGHLSAAAACSRFLGLDEQQTVNALGIAGTQACGLKKVFGTMCKPFHAGRASEVGIMAALLALEGFTSADDILEGAAGLFQAMKGTVNEIVLANLGKTWDIEDIAQKYHASCHATHSPIEAARSIVRKERLAIGDIKSIKVHSSEVALGAAYRTDANTGLEGKFCIPYCVANALLRANTGMQAFTDEKVRDSEVKALMSKISLVKDNEILLLSSKVEVDTNDGRSFSAFCDVMQEIPPLDEKREKIKSKFLDLAGAVLGDAKAEKLIDEILSLEKMKNMNELVATF
jgi:2-methylcitrate dehydratase PrpD